MKEAAENILPFERNLFFALNGSESPFLDNAMLTFTGRYVWVLMLLFILFLFFYRTPKKEAFVATLFFVLVFVVCDQLSSSFFKPLFERLRPTYHPDFRDWVDVVNGYRSGGYGFISGHATNSFGIALFLSLLFGNRWVTIPVFIWALVNSYSRIYLGVHFVSDVVAGALVGALSGWLLYEIYVWFRHRFLHVPERKLRRSVYSFQSGKLLGTVIFCYLFLVVLLSPFLATIPR